MVRDAPVKFSKESVNSLVVQSVSARAIRVSGETYSHAIALTRDQLIPDWRSRAIDELSIDDFDALFDAYKRMVADFSEGEQLALFHDNARRFYRL